MTVPLPSMNRRRPQLAARPYVLACWLSTQSRCFLRSLTAALASAGRRSGCSAITAKFRTSWRVSFNFCCNFGKSCILSMLSRWSRLGASKMDPAAEGQFFFPFTPPADQEQAYQLAKHRTEIDSGKLTKRRFHALGYTHNGRQYVASVGKQDDITRKTVLAIFQTERDPRLFWLFVGDDRDGTYQVGGMAPADHDGAATEFEAVPRAAGLAPNRGASGAASLPVPASGNELAAQ